MKKKVFVFLILSLGVIGSLVSVYGEEKIDFTGLIKGDKIISPAGAYASGKAEFNSGYIYFLNKLGEFLKENDGLIIEIGGHSDNSGGTKINRRLSLNRAQKVKNYLLRKTGISGDRIVVKGYSSNFPIADNSTLKGKTKNRRVEIIALQNVDPAGKLTYIRRDVFTKSPDKIDFIRATINQDLFHLYRVLTRKKSNANITFQDLSKINLGPQSLMIMYSILLRDLSLPRKKNIRLSTGGLRTKLEKLKGGLQVETPSCVINSNSVEILVGIDEKKMSALSVFDGKSEVKAQGKKVEVPGGYGTIVEMGEPPQQPEPLPQAPRLMEPVESAIMLPGKPGISETPVRFTWLRVEDRYHLQVAHDPGFEQIIEDMKVPGNTVTLSFGRGTYYWRAAAIDKRGIEGYSSQSSFEIMERPSELPLHITPAPKTITETAQQRFSISGKTAPGAQIFMDGRPVQTKANGEFSRAIALSRGWNHVKVRALHPDFKEKVVWLTFFRHAFCSSALSMGFGFDYAAGSDVLDHSVTYRLGTTFCLAPRLEAELSAGLTRLRWQGFPGGYDSEATAIPFTASLHLMLSKGKTVPYLDAGLTSYLTFAENLAAGKKENVFFMSPEVGGGLDFTVYGSRFRFEAIYSPFLKKEPFFPEMTHRLAFILKLMLNLGKK